MKLLSIDTSTKNFSLAVSRGEKILRSRNVKLNKVLSSSIIPGIENVLDKSGVSLKELDGFAVGLGPGSFTSLRVGISTVKGLAFAVGKPVVGISSLDILAMNVPDPENDICTLVDARRNLVYASLYRCKGSRIKRKSPYLLTNIEDVLGRIKEKTIFLGDGVKLYREAIARKCPAEFAGEKHCFPQAKQLALLALEQLSKKKRSARDGPVFRKGNMDKLVPMYLYPKECQIRK